MIAFLADGFNEDEELFPSALSYSIKMNKSGVYSAFLGCLSIDAEGQKAVHALIDNKVFFAPDLFSEKKTEYPKQMQSDSSAFFALDFDCLKENLEINSDIKVCFISAYTLSFKAFTQKLIENIKEAISEVLFVFDFSNNVELSYLEGIDKTKILALVSDTSIDGYKTIKKCDVIEELGSLYNKL